MAQDIASQHDAGQPPLVLTVPGLHNSGPGHWQSLWEQHRHDCHRVELGMWDQPHRNTWVNQLNLAIRAARRPVVLAAHSLGVIAVVWWAQLEQEAASLVKGALLVAPPEVDFFPRDPRVGTFAPVPTGPLPFPSILAASRNDPWIGLHAARRLAKGWGSRFEDLGQAGHLNADSALGLWPQGQGWLNELIARPDNRSLDGSPLDARGAQADFGAEQPFPRLRP
ncbi:RBBP9/YdeN family alpha/beta hydrolase [Novosphingobium rosa]|uniref:RBBP9/YdeN family alpha/beta hydrolase n=1 Tax=Novosphingobium rosa TaxID=76978 RepID=UPI00083380A3|nr:alpha/beta hydrolase [Novosphingobium rosa]